MSWVKDSVSSFLDGVIKKDQQQEQWFVVTKASLYDQFDEQAKRIDLSGKWLVAVPDICELIDVEDHESVWWLDVSDNDIRILNTDLSCLRYLKSLDLSYNQIQTVQTLWDLPALQELNMEHNDLTTTENLPDMPMLERLSLAYNKIKEVKDLDHLKNLVVLELQNNVIEHVVGLENLEKLEKLRWDFDKIKSGDLSPLLEKLDELEIIDAVGNVLWEEAKRQLLEKLQF